MDDLDALVTQLRSVAGRVEASRGLRGDRDRLIVELSALGVKPGVIARHAGLSRQRVLRIVATGATRLQET